MPKAMLFWILMLFWVLCVGFHWYSSVQNWGVGGSFLEFLLFMVLGWATFGKPVQ